MKATMKFAAIAAIALGAATTITSCNKGGDEPDRDEVQIFTSVSGMTRAPQLDETGEGVFSNGDTFGLVVMASGAEAERFDYTVGSTKLYWDQMPPLAEGLLYGFAAVYPNLPEFNIVGTNISFDFNAAAAAVAAENPDLLYAEAGVATNAPVELKFRHAMHKFNVKLTSNYFTDGELATAEVMPLLKSTAKVYVFSGATPEGASGEISDYPFKTGANTSWIVAPQNLDAADAAKVRIKIGDYDITYWVPASLTVLEPGEVTTLNLALNRDAVSTEGMDVSQWETETEVPGTISVTE